MISKIQLHTNIMYHTHTHTYTHIQIYIIYIYIHESEKIKLSVLIYTLVKFISRWLHLFIQQGGNNEKNVNYIKQTRKRVKKNKIITPINIAVHIL